MRNNLMPMGITHMSAGSSTQPGGYALPTEELDQFQLSDERPIDDVVMMIQQKGYQPVFKDWESSWH